tara:strand:- start:483 stop:839 length:357 start_codon:yes stop_codon:yes gene_type:complete
MSGLVGTSNTRSKVVGRSLDTALAWANLDGTGTTAFNTSYGFAGHTDVSTGVYRFTLLNPAKDANYCVVASHDTPSGADADASPSHYENPTTTTFAVTTFGDGAYIDADRVFVAVFGE